ncbi:MAG: type II/IV secretion system protein [Candidatus Sungbacteria bacterium]|nr:type II/IV secretion system protein [Candidatus Sungbacteria bacterium]
MVDVVDNAILRMLVEAKFLDEAQVAQVEQALAAGNDLYTTLVVGKLINDETYAQVKAAALGVPYINLFEVSITREVLNIIPESTAKSHLIVAYQQTDQGLKVAMADPSDRQIVDFIAKKVDMPVEVALASRESLKEALSHYQESLQVELTSLIEEAQQASGTDDVNKAAEDLPIIKITDTILKHAILQSASDIHIEPTEKQVIIRYRVDGILHDMLTLEKKVLTGIVARIKVLANLKIDEHRLPQDGRFKIETSEYRVAFRVSTLPVFDGEKIVMRLLDESGHSLGLDDIGMSQHGLIIFRNNINKPHGMILVTGPTGSGKTTTLYAAMKELNTADVNISTIEDPIEYRMERINQTQVQPKIGLTFSNGLRALVRQDPDIIMVGEIRDQETASLAVNAALTGHMVLSTLHTNSAAGSIPRLLDMGVEPFLIASTTNLMMAQRLVRRLCEKCRQEAPITDAVIDSLSAVVDMQVLLATLQREKVTEVADLKTLRMYVPVGCSKCNEGYKGRVGIYEFLDVTPSMQKLITGKTTAQELEEAARKEQGMVTMVEDGIIKALQGVTTMEEVLRVAKE